MCPSCLQPHSVITVQNHLFFSSLAFPLQFGHYLFLTSQAISLSRGSAAILSAHAGPALSILFPPLDVSLPPLHLLHSSLELVGASAITSIL